MRTHLPFAFSFFLIATTCTAQWTPLGANIQSIVSMAEQTGILYAASYPNGVYTSLDNGTTWNASSTGLPTNGSNIFARSVGSNATNIFAGTHDGIYTSDNGGGTWTLANGTLTASNQIYANKFFFFGGTTFAVFTGTIGMGGGIYSTTTNGTSWAVSHVGMGTNARVYQLIEFNNNLYAATSTGLYSSADNGMNWTQVPTLNYSIYAASVAGTGIAAITAFGYKYINLGTFTVGDAMGTPANPTEGEMVSFDGNIYAITGDNDGCLISTDGGQNFSPFNTGLTTIDQSSLEKFLNVGNSELYVGALFDAYMITGGGLGVAELHVEQVNITPTAFEDVIRVELTDRNSDPQSWVMVIEDVQGCQILAEPLRANTTWVDAAHLPAGAYTYRIIGHRGGMLDAGKLIAY